MEKIKKYKLLKNLPMYPAGTIVTHRFEILPSKFRENDTYCTDGEWITDEGTQAPLFLERLIAWCADSQRDDCEGWVEEIQ